LLGLPFPIPEVPLNVSTKDLPLPASPDNPLMPPRGIGSPPPFPATVTRFFSKYTFLYTVILGKSFFPDNYVPCASISLVFRPDYRFNLQIFFRFSPMMVLHASYLSVTNIHSSRSPISRSLHDFIPDPESTPVIFFYSCQILP